MSTVTEHRSRDVPIQPLTSELELCKVPCRWYSSSHHDLMPFNFGINELSGALLTLKNCEINLISIS